MNSQDNKQQETVRVLAREMAQELDLAELAQVSGGSPVYVCTINTELDQNMGEF